MNEKKRVVVAMSGGVDSSLAAYLLQEQGYQVIGITMRLFSTEDPYASKHNKSCCSIEDALDAKRVCQLLGIPHYTLNFEKEFKKHVIDYFISEYAKGRTPHPCIACNDKMKFAFFLRRAQALEADFIATGHYARKVTTNKGEHYLEKAVDDDKDQTYVLYGMGQEELSQVLFPMGDFHKSDIRRIARELYLPVADKPDSQDICFVPTGDYREFLSSRTDQRPGAIMNADGKILGMHQGVSDYTIGQRRNLGIPAQGKPVYVIDINPELATVTIGSDEDLYHSSLVADRANFVSGTIPEDPIEATVKVRYKASEEPAIIKAQENGEIRVDFSEPQRAITPGQAVVFYHKDRVLGGAVIREAVTAP